MDSEKRVWIIPVGKCQVIFKRKRGKKTDNERENKKTKKKGVTTAERTAAQRK